MGRVGVQGVRADVRCHQTIQAGNSLEPREVRGCLQHGGARGMAFPEGRAKLPAAARDVAKEATAWRKRKAR